MKSFTVLYFGLLLCSSCAIKKSSDSECQKKFELIENNFINKKNSRFIRIKDNDQLQYVSGFITARFFFRGLKCFVGKQFGRVKKLLGQPHFILNYNKFAIYNYYFDEGCNIDGEVCHYWEFVVDRKKMKSYYSWKESEMIKILV